MPGRRAAQHVDLIPAHRQQALPLRLSWHGDLRLMISRYIERVRTWVVRFHLQIVRLTFGLRPVPVWYWAGVRFALRGTATANALAPHLSPTNGEALRIPLLRRLLAEDELGAWALDPATVDFLWARLHLDRPVSIIECGAGTSTVVLAAYADRVRRTSGQQVRIVTVEQSTSVRQIVLERLTRLNLAAHVLIIETPTAHDGSYTLDPAAIGSGLSGQRADWLLIDGPAGPDGCRTPALVQLRALCAPGGRWYLDDAFRDGELRALRSWAATPGIHVSGIYPVGKGVATGRVNDGHSDGCPATSMTNVSSVEIGS
jgi:hypothetical protein